MNKTNLMCNSLNHSPSCRCGFGGEGHLGRRSFGNDFSVSRNSQSVFTLHPQTVTRESGHYTSYINPNAHCPVCGDEVYFYQSPDGGRVFFDQIGYPWTKHPCTDNNLWRTSTQHIKFIGDKASQLAVYFIHKWEDDGYFPLVCKHTGFKVILGEFLYENSQDDVYLPNLIRLCLEEPIMIAPNSLFFIKDIDSSRGLYELKFCFRQSHINHTKIQTIKAEISSQYRPVLKNGRITFRNFGIKIIKKCDIPDKPIIRTRIELSNSKKNKKNPEKDSGGIKVKTKHPLDGVKITALVKKKT